MKIYNAKINFKIKETDENFAKIILYHVFFLNSK
ncbi:hypothetical protein FB550_111218 [Neobacillus bataviensis]|uniref:Uncharacterized protein n=1 Tax=Neobacillus bataviensis TaxID=220685 RepID=A0A561D0G3_9BACI|nr:hypothetical protein FB550_111218 [Neobacillus bataviensis]